MARLILAWILVGLGLTWSYLSTSHGASDTIDIYPVDGIINPVVAEYMHDAIQQSSNEQATAVIFQLDTPGGTRALDPTYCQIVAER